MIKIYCDICSKEPEDQEFACEVNTSEIIMTMTPEMNPAKRLEKKNYHICRGCFYKHINKLLKNEKK